MQKAEELFYGQKSRAQGVHEGDMNTSYFHKSLRVRTHKQQITKLQRDDGSETSEIHQMGDLAVNFYKKLIGEVDGSVQGLSVAELSALLRHKLDDNDVLQLNRAITGDEIASSFRRLGRDKVTGPDGFPA
ncbi:unnamed protein product [Linum trigynum]|uniref:Uncharacterized protein n=1 Tax=Linum trigynum TaxID=586398 RepID=A0AAV2E7U4_9ROSI